MEQKITQIKEEYLSKIAEATTLEALDGLFLALFGKNGALTLLPRDFSSLEAEELKKVGPAFNQTKQALEKAISDRRQEVREATYAKLADEKLALEATIKERKGHIHPSTSIANEITDLFGKLGFQIYEAPQIDTDYNNFEVLNIPQEHPARDMWDTLYLDYPESKTTPGKLLLRTHTSNSQNRIMLEHKPPVRMMILGPCFRYENVDARHEHTFNQFEIVYIDKGLSMAHLQYLSEYCLKAIFGTDVKVRLRPKYYPFVEPGAGVDGLCMACTGDGCKICGGVGWLELAGAGMIHPKVLENGGIDPKVYSGIAWGFGPDRMLMIKKNINDVRKLLSADLKFLEEIS